MSIGREREGERHTHTGEQVGRRGKGYMKDGLDGLVSMKRKGKREWRQVDKVIN